MLVAGFTQGLAQKAHDPKIKKGTLKQRCSFLALGVLVVRYGSYEPLLLAVCSTNWHRNSWNYHAKHDMKILRALMSRQHSQAKYSIDQDAFWQNEKECSLLSKDRCSALLPAM